MKKFLFTWTLCWLLLSSSNSRAEEAYSILELGTWQQEQLPKDAKDGEEWLGLFVEDGHPQLKRGILRISNVRDELVDGEGQTTGRDVRFQVGEQVYPLADRTSPELIMRGKGIAPGAVKSDPSASGDLTLGTSMIIGQQYFGKKYSLISTGTAVVGETYGESDIRDYCVRWVLHDGTARSQKIHCIDRIGPGSGPAAVVFVGDLNRDGAPDLILDAHPGEHSSTRQLFISGYGADVAGMHDVWLSKVAEFVRGSGC